MFNSLLNSLDLSKIKYPGLRTLYTNKKYLRYNNVKKLKDVDPILFIIIYDSHLKYFLSIVNYLEKQKINYSLVSLRSDFKEQLLPYSKRLINIGDFFGKIDIIISFIIQTITFFKYLFFNNTIKSFATLKYYKDYYLIRLSLKHIIRRNKINLIMMFKGDGLYAQAIGQLIHENNYKIKIIVMQHGLIASIPQYKNLRIDEFWVWSKFFKNRLLNLGVNYSIKVLGDPTTDNFFNRKELLKIKKTEKIKILFAPNHGNSHTSKSQVVNTLNWIIRYAKNNFNIALTIKPHPGDNYNIIKKNIKNSDSIKNLTIISKNDDIIINDYDIMIINNSTIGMEAAMNNIPVLVLAENKNQVMVKQYLDYGFAEVAYNYEELIKKIDFIKTNYALFQEKAKLFIDEMYEYKGESKNKILKELSKYN